MAKISNT